MSLTGAHGFIPKQAVFGQGTGLSRCAHQTSIREAVAAAFSVVAPNMTCLKQARTQPAFIAELKQTQICNM